MTKVKTLPSLDRLNELFEYRNGVLYRETVTQGRKEAGTTTNKGYREIYVDGKPYFAHRVIWKMFNGSDPTYTIDHINGNKQDNRIENLRDVPQQTNSMNTKAKGVHFYSGRNKWRAKIQIFGKQYHLGYFDSEEESTEVYKAFQTAYAFLG